MSYILNDLNVLTIFQPKAGPLNSQPPVRWYDGGCCPVLKAASLWGCCGPGLYPWPGGQKMAASGMAMSFEGPIEKCKCRHFVQKGVRLLRRQQQKIEPSVWPFWAQGPEWQHRPHAHEANTGGLSEGAAKPSSLSRKNLSCQRPEVYKSGTGSTFQSWRLTLIKVVSLKEMFLCVNKASPQISWNL